MFEAKMLAENIFMVKTRRTSRQWYKAFKIVKEFNFSVSCILVICQLSVEVESKYFSHTEELKYLAFIFFQEMIIRGCAPAKGGRKPREGNIGIQLMGALTQEKEREREPPE